MKKIIRVMMSATFVLFAPTISHGFQSPPKVIALIPPDNNLENENRIEKLCPRSAPEASKCRQEKLRPRTWKLTAYEMPKSDSTVAGEILVIGTPGRGLKAQFVPTGKPPVDFPSDSHGTDWGYDCYFQFTVRDVAEDWIQLPQRPFPRPVWINVKKDWPQAGEADSRTIPAELAVDMVYSTPTLGNVVITQFSEATFTYRKENANDMLCGEEPEKVDPKDLKTHSKPLSVLFDKDGHLVTWPAYCRGC